MSYRRTRSQAKDPPTANSQSNQFGELALSDTSELISLEDKMEILIETSNQVNRNVQALTDMIKKLVETRLNDNPSPVNNNNSTTTPKTTFSMVPDGTTTTPTTLPSKRGYSLGTINSGNNSGTVRQVESFKSKLKERSLTALLALKAERRAYLKLHESVPTIQTSLTETQKRSIISNVSPNLNLDDFDDLDTVVAEELITKWILPKTSETWKQSLKAATIFPTTDQINSVCQLTNFYENFNTYTHMFLQSIEILDKADAKIKPEFGKPFKRGETESLLSIYLAQFPNGWGTALHTLFFPGRYDCNYDIKKYIKMFETEFTMYYKNVELIIPLENILKITTIQKLTSENATLQNLNHINKENSTSDHESQEDTNSSDSESTSNSISSNDDVYIIEQNFVRACSHLVRGEDCPYGEHKCRNSHKPEHVEQARIRIIQYYNRSKSNNHSNSNYKSRKHEDHGKKQHNHYHNSKHNPNNNNQQFDHKNKFHNQNKQFGKQKNRKATNFNMEQVEDDQLAHLVETIIMDENDVNSMESKSLQSKMHFEAAIITDKFIFTTVLLDSGAIKFNYMPKKFYENHLKTLEKFSKQIDNPTYVTVADGRKCKVEFVVTIPMLIDNKFPIELSFNVYDAGDREEPLIIGQPSLLNEARELFIFAINNAHIERKKNSNNSSSLAILDIDPLATKGIEPFSQIYEHASEEENIPFPTNFTDILCFMEQSYEESIEIFSNSYPKHISQELARSTMIMKLMEEKGVKVFVPKTWEGVVDVEVDLEFIVEPERMRPPPINIPEKIFPIVRKEFFRLLQYFYTRSNSDVSSNLAIAPKTKFNEKTGEYEEYCRICGNYIRINKYLKVGCYPIPNVIKQIHRLSKYIVFAEFDLTNAFHQLRLSKRTRQFLSVQTPWGHYEPIFMPEGISPATGVLQWYIDKIFAQFDWIIVLFDNIVVMAHDYIDLYNKIDEFFDICIKNNIYLKLSKSKIGFNTVDFFGYIVSNRTYHLDKKRIKALLDIPLPKNTTDMRIFLGTSLFFKQFIANYGDISAKLYDAVKKDFKWNADNIKSLEEPFEKLKEYIANVSELYHPDLSLPWILRTDASDKAVGAVLAQVNSDKQIQPLAYVSEKLSESAKKWSTIEKEAYAIVYAIRKLESYLKGKEFVLQCDHANLQWIEKSKVDKIIRWCLYLQSFKFEIVHIPGSANRTADMLSRLNNMENEDEFISILHQVHGGRNAHFGLNRMMELLAEEFPGHGFSVEQVREFIKNCPWCQKFKAGIHYSYPAIKKSLKANDVRSVVACDTLEILEDKYEYRYILVIIDLFSKYVQLYPVKNKDAHTTANCLIQFYASYGLFDIFHTDPGSDFMSKVVKLLLSWLGIKQQITLVNNPQADGVEATNREILRHLKYICAELRMKDEWSLPSIISWIQILLNSYKHSETSYSPFNLMFGTRSNQYYKSPQPLPEEFHNEFLLSQSKILSELRENANKYHQDLIRNRNDKNSHLSWNFYIKGDYVFNISNKVHDKLTAKKQGPMKVLEHDPNSNRVLCYDLVTGAEKEFFKQHLILFTGTADEALKIAISDTDQFIVSNILSYQGDIDERSKMSILAEFNNREILWIPYSSDIANNIKFQEFIKNNQQLNLLLQSVKEVNKLKSNINKTQYNISLLGIIFYIPLYIWIKDNMKQLQLPNMNIKSYFVKVLVSKVSSRNYHLKVEVFNQEFNVNQWFIYKFKGKTSLSNDSEIEITLQFVKEFEIQKFMV